MDAKQSWPQRDLKVNDTVPGFTLMRYPEGTFDLTQSFEKNQTTVLYFYGQGSADLGLALVERLPEFKEHQAEVYAVTSGDSSELKATHPHPQIPLLVDEAGRVRALFGMPEREPELTEQALYVIDPDGLVRWIATDMAEPAAVVDELLRNLQRIWQEQPGGIMAAGGGRPQD